MSFGGIRFCYLCYMCCVIVIMLTAAFSISTYLTFCFSNYELVIENWKSDVLLQLRVSRDKCNKDEQQLILYTWPGTKSACDCRENTAWAIQYLLDERTPKKQIYVGDTCNSTQRFYGCFSIYQTRIQQLKYFSDQEGQKFTFCAKYGYGQNYYPPNQECLKGNICGSKKSSEFCLKSDICPIYDFGFGDPPDGAIQQDNNFWISRQSDQHLPIVKIQVGEGDGICTNPKQLPITKGRQDFILMKNEKIDCERDERYIKMLSTTETKFYEVNNMNYIIKKLIFMEISDDFEWNLYKRPYLAWKDECRDEELKLFKQQGNYQFFILLIWKSIIIILFISIVLVIFLVCNGNNAFVNDWFSYDIQMKDFQIQFFAKENIFKFTVYFMFIMFLGISTNKINEIREIIQEYGVMNCSDEYTNSLLEREQYELDQYEQQIEGFVVFLVIIIFIDVVLVLIFIFLMCQNRNNPQQYQQLDQPVENPIVEQIEEQQGEQLQIQTDQG